LVGSAKGKARVEKKGEREGKEKEKKRGSPCLIFPS
jgi:hypothetical protein